MSTSNGYNAFLMLIFFSNKFFKKFYSTKRSQTKRIKLCEKKKIDHHARLGENCHFFLFNGSSIAGHLVA